MGSSYTQIWDHLKIKAKVKLQLNIQYKTIEEKEEYFQAVRKAVTDAKYADKDFKRVNPQAKLEYVITGDNCSDVERGILVLQLLYVNLPTILDLGEEIIGTGYEPPEIQHVKTKPPEYGKTTPPSQLELPGLPDSLDLD